MQPARRGDCRGGIETRTYDLAIGPRPPQEIGLTHGIVSAPQPEPVEAALDVLAAGGNLVDAAIAVALVQAVVDPHAVDFGMSAQEAVSAPRFCATSDVIEVNNRVLRATQRALETKRYPVFRHAYSHMFPLVHAVRRLDGRQDGGADPGGDGLAVAV